MFKNQATLSWNKSPAKWNGETFIDPSLGDRGWTPTSRYPASPSLKGICNILPRLWVSTKVAPEYVAVPSSVLDEPDGSKLPCANINALNKHSLRTISVISIVMNRKICPPSTPHAGDFSWLFRQ